MGQLAPGSRRDQPAGQPRRSRLARDAGLRPDEGGEAFRAPSQREPLLALLRGLERGETLIVITGPAGVGKTTLLQGVLPTGESGGTQRVWLRNENGGPLTRARLMLDLATKNLAARTAPTLAIDAPAPRRRTILIVDNAHLLTPEAAVCLVGLLETGGLETGDTGTGTLQLVLVGRPSLWTRLRDAGLAERVQVAGEVAGLPPSEVREYLQARLESSGTPIDEILTEGARLALLRRVRWRPAELNLILRITGEIPAGQGVGWITREVVEQAALPSESASVEHWPGADLPAAAITEPPDRAEALKVPARPRQRRFAALATGTLATVLVFGGLCWSLIPTDGDRVAGRPAVPLPPARVASGPAAPAGNGPARVASPPAPVAAPPDAAAEMAILAPPQRPGPQASPPNAMAPAPDVSAARTRPALTMTAAQLDDILRRGEAMLARGDIVAARGLYKRAALANSGAAATIVGKTYDPAFLSGIGASKVKPAPARAATWYRRAAALGDQEGRERLVQLRSSSSQIAGND